MADRNNQPGANRARLNFIDDYPHTAAPTAEVVSSFINDTIAPAAAARPQAASRAAASLLASVEGHGRQLHAQLRESPTVSAKDISAERGLAALQDRWGAHPWVPAAYAPRPPIAPLIIRKMVWITEKVLARPGATTNDLAALWAGSPRDPENAGLLLRALITSGASNLTKTVATQAAKILAAQFEAADAEASRLQQLHNQAAEERDWAELEFIQQEDDAAQRMLALHEAEMDEADQEAEIIWLMQDAEDHLGQQQDEDEEGTEAGRRNDEAFIDLDDNDDIPFFGDSAEPPSNNEEQHPQPSPRMSPVLPAPESNEDPFAGLSSGSAVQPARGTVRSRPDSDSDSEPDDPPRQRRRTAVFVSVSNQESHSDSDADEPPHPAPARRVRRPRASPANRQEEVGRIAQRVYNTTMSQLRQGTFTRQMPLADRQQIAWNARAAVLDTIVAQDEGIAESDNEPRTSEDELGSEYDDDLMSSPRTRRGGAILTNWFNDSDDD